MKLSDEDRAAIAAAWVGCAFGNAGARAIQSAAENTYLIGLRAGMERAAKICDALLSDRIAADPDAWMFGVTDCAAAIRNELGK